jgi:hypothetical protein
MRSQVCRALNCQFRIRYWVILVPLTQLAVLLEYLSCLFHRVPRLGALRFCQAIRSLVWSLTSLPEDIDRVIKAVQ